MMGWTTRIKKDGLCNVSLEYTILNKLFLIHYSEYAIFKIDVDLAKKVGGEFGIIASHLLLFFQIFFILFCLFS